MLGLLFLYFSWKKRTLGALSLLCFHQAKEQNRVCIKRVMTFPDHSWKWETLAAFVVNE